MQYFTERSSRSSPESFHFELGEKQIASCKQNHVPFLKESDSCAQYLQWAKQHKRVRCVSDKVPSDSPLLKLLPGWTAETFDFSPASRIDDEVYARYPDVWQNVPRGCCMIKLSSPDGRHFYMWAVLATRKFTGHEDDSNVDSKLYTVQTEAGAQSSHTIVTLKENGNVLHLSARRLPVDLLLGRTTDDSPSPNDAVVLFIGSKKVHVGLVWSNTVSGASDVQQGRVRLAEQAVDFSGMRYDLVKEMITNTIPYVTPQVVSFLLDHQLVISFEYLSPQGSGPIDNRTLHHLERSTPYAFALTPNRLDRETSMQLCLSPLWTLQRLRQYGFETVLHFAVPASDLNTAKAEIATLPQIEGAVLYHINAGGVLSLEKCKAGGYVVVRSFREKLKNFFSTSARARNDSASGHISQLISSLAKCGVVHNGAVRRVVSSTSASDSKPQLDDKMNLGTTLTFQQIQTLLQSHRYLVSTASLSEWVNPDDIEGGRFFISCWFLLTHAPSPLR